MKTRVEMTAEEANGVWVVLENSVTSSERELITARRGLGKQGKPGWGVHASAQPTLPGFRGFAVGQVDLKARGCGASDRSSWKFKRGEWRRR